MHGSQVYSSPMKSLREEALAMRADGYNFTEIGRALLISRQRAQQLCEGDGSAEVRVVLSGEIVTHLDAFRGDQMERPAAVVAILKSFFR